CVITGDPHIVTFDNQNINTQGICKYTIARSPDGTDVTKAFNVEAKFENRHDNDMVSYVEYVTIEVYGYYIQLGRDNAAWVNGELVDPMHGVVHPGLRIVMNGNYVRVMTDFGLAVENDGKWTALVKFPVDFVGATEGLCGNNDENPDNDLLTRDG
ncbi:hypothetical protein CAPTEDRAFT_40659, partial [Capitella teleta]